jgi:long-subunit acyl-CoA synthetase (AMP-forming)
MLGPNVTIGYYQNPEANATALEGEWLHTGDIAIVNEKEHIFIVDRLKVHPRDSYLTAGIDQVQGESSGAR